MRRGAKFPSMPMRSKIFALLAGAAAGSAAPPLPQVHEVRMTGRFVPAETTARAGDTVRFILQSGGPHNIQFFADSMSGGALRLLEGAMGGKEKVGPVSSPMLVLEKETYEIAVPALPPGRYPFVCLPHQGSRMLGALIVMP